MQTACELILQNLLFVLHFNLKVRFVAQCQVKSVLEVFELKLEPLFGLNCSSRICFQMTHLLLVLVMGQGDRLVGRLGLLFATGRFDPLELLFHVFDARGYGLLLCSAVKVHVDHCRVDKSVLL